MKRYVLSVFILILISSACSKIPPPVKNHLLKNSTFVYLYFETEEECLENQPYPDFFINCYQQLDFLEDNKIRLVLSDIIYDGNYKIESKNIKISMEPNSEIPSGELTFEFLNPNIIYNIEDKTYWKRVRGNSVWD